MIKKRFQVKLIVFFLLVAQVFLTVSTSVAQAPTKRRKRGSKRITKKVKATRIRKKINFYQNREKINENAENHARFRSNKYRLNLRSAKTQNGRRKLIKAKIKYDKRANKLAQKKVYYKKKVNFLKKRILSYLEVDKVLYGRASWYGSGYRTASGERFNPNDLTAAMRGYRGRKVKVVNLANGKSVVVRINDHGPASYTGRVIDLSRGSFSKIASTSQGVISKVKLYVY